LARLVAIFIDNNVMKRVYYSRNVKVCHLYHLAGKGQACLSVSESGNIAARNNAWAGGEVDVTKLRFTRSSE